MSWYATSNRRGNRAQITPQSALTPVAVQNFVSIFRSKIVARSRCSFSHRPSEAMYASNVAAGKRMSAIFPTGPAFESKRCLANARLRSSPASGWGNPPDATARTFDSWTAPLILGNAFEGFRKRAGRSGRIQVIWWVAL